MPTDRPPAPTKRWYRVAVAVAVAGFLAAGAWWPYATTRVFDAVEHFERTGPFGGPVELTQTGTHTFWIEGACLSCHGNLPDEYRSAATVAVVDPAGRELELRPAPSRVYNTARREGRSLWLFDVEAPGVHRLSLDFDTSGEWDNTPPGNIAISRGEGLPIGIVRPMFRFAAGATAIAAAIALTTYLRRRHHYDRSAHPAPARP